MCHSLSFLHRRHVELVVNRKLDLPAYPCYLSCDNQYFAIKRSSVRVDQSNYIIPCEVLYAEYIAKHDRYLLTSGAIQ